MSPQLTLQTPLQIPPEEIPIYLQQLWSSDQTGNAGSNTFCLLVWQPSWLEQQLVRTGKINGPIIGSHRQEIIYAARKFVLEGNLPHSTTPFDKSITTALGNKEGSTSAEDLRGQHINSAISALQPRRLITLAPTLDPNQNLQTMVAAYCPLPEDGANKAACGDVVVLRGHINSLTEGLDIIKPLLPDELPSWLWWNSNLDEVPDLFDQLAISQRRLIIDTALGEPGRCLGLLHSRIKTGQAVNDLNWLRLRNWRETLAMVFDPPQRRDALNHVSQLDIDIEGNHPVQGLLLAAWLADRLNWKFQSSNTFKDGSIQAIFKRSDNTPIQFRLMPLPIGNPSIHPGQLVGVRMICKPSAEKEVCVILGSETGECMRLEAGGMARMELLEEMVPIQSNPVEKDVARLLSSSRGNTSPLLAASSPIALNLFNSSSADN